MFSGDMKKILKCVSDSAESYCNSDLVEKCIRSNGSWNLLPLQVPFRSLIESMPIYLGVLPVAKNFFELCFIFSKYLLKLNCLKMFIYGQDCRLMNKI